MLMCPPCWQKVLPSTQREVYRTVRLRGPAVNKTWAAWWRAQALATVENARERGVEKDSRGMPLEEYLKDAYAFADRLEGKA